MRTITRSLLFSLLLLPVLTVFSQQPKTALDLNNHLAAITDSLYYFGVQWGNKLEEVRTSKEFSKLTPYRKKITAYIDAKRKEVLKLQDIGGSEDLRLAMLDFLSFERKMIDEGFVPLEKLGSKSTTDDINAAILSLNDSVEKENEMLAQVHEAQKAYSIKNGFPLEEDEDGY